MPNFLSSTFVGGLLIAQLSAQDCATDRIAEWVRSPSQPATRNSAINAIQRAAEVCGITPEDVVRTINMMELRHRAGDVTPLNEP